MTFPTASRAARRRQSSSPSVRRAGKATRTRLLTALLLTIGLTAACTSPPDPATGPDEQIAEFVTALQQLDPNAAADFTSDPAVAAVALNEVLNSLRPDSVSVAAGPVTRNGADSATTTATVNWELPDAGTWTYPATWTWQRSSDGDWQVDWSPSVIHPKLGARQTLAVQTTDPQDGVMVDRNNNQLVSPVRVYSVVLLPAQVPDVAATAATVAAVLTPLEPSITADAIAAGAAEAIADATAPAEESAESGSPAATATGSSAAPTTAVDLSTVGYTVINLREPDYLKVKAQLDPIPGLSFPSEVRNLPPT
ncbi:MAG: NTF2-like N-terminal transpeptidase domain-containing protein, partial [Nakamurella sp.]